MRRVRRREDDAAAQLQRAADRICSLIVASDYPAVDIAIEVRRLREFVEVHLPGREGLFDLVYGGRFRRLWQQFRAGPQPLDW